MEWLTKKAQKAVGIPDRSNYVPPPEINDSRIFQFTRHDHVGERAGCFVSGTKVLLADGSQKEIQECRVGDLVWTLYGPRKVLKVWDNGPSSDWLEVRYGSFCITCTQNHPFWLDSVGWIPIGELEGRLVHGSVHGLSDIDQNVQTGEGVSSEEGARTELLELEGRSVQRSGGGVVWFWAPKEVIQGATNRAERRALREMREDAGGGEEDRSAPHRSLEVQRGQLHRERASAVRGLSRRRGSSVLGVGREAVHITRLPRVSRARYDLEIEGAHHYVAEGFLVHNSHHDLRLGDPKTGLTYNWAGKKWPEPGTGTYYIPQPTHDYDYLNFQGRIESGYGKGEVRLGRHEPAEVVSSSPDRVEFNLYRGRTPEQYVIRKVDDSRWVLNNVTPFRGGGPWSPLVPAEKPRYREGSTEKIDFGNPNEVFQPKIDGALGVYALRAGKPMKVFSYRVAKSTPTKLLEHTMKVPGWDKNVVPPELDNTVLRGEVYAVDKKGRAIKEKDIGALLNTSTLASREKQEARGYLRTSVFDVVKYKGRDVTKLPYAQRLEILKEVVDKIPGLHLPPMAYSPEDKQKLFRNIQKGKEPLTREGVVAWDLKEPRVTKVKIRPDYNLYIRGVVPSTHEGWAGGVQYSLTPKGPIVGTMGSGFTHKERTDMLKNPQKYVGRVARAKAHEQFDSGALRVPVFSGWDPQKSEEKLFKESSDRGEIPPPAPAIRSLSRAGKKLLPFSDEVIKALGNYLSERKPGIKPRIRKFAAVRERDGAYEVVSKNSRVLGRHATVESARRQEKAIWARRRKLASLLGI